MHSATFSKNRTATIVGPITTSCRSALGQAKTSRRGCRVTLLLVGVVLLSIADLAVTVTYITSQGMLETNPIAVMLVRSTQSVWPLMALKVATVGLCVTLLYRTRRHRNSEIGAWMALAILAWVSVRWHGYSTNMPFHADSHLANGYDQSRHWLFVPGAKASPAANRRRAMVPTS